MLSWLSSSIIWLSLSVIMGLAVYGLFLRMQRKAENLSGQDAASDFKDLEPAVETHQVESPPIAALDFGREYGTRLVTKPSTTIGRHSDNDISISDVRVSRCHALLVKNVEGNFEIHNRTAGRSEPNPILVNGNYVEHAVLKDGDQVTIGGVNFTFSSCRLN